MDIKKEMNGNICTLSPEGRMDTLTSGELEEAVNAACAECEKLVLDMAEVDYVSSAGIRVIIQAHQTVGKDRFSLKNVSKNVMQLLAMTGFDRVLTFESRRNYEQGKLRKRVLQGRRGCRGRSAT